MPSMLKALSDGYKEYKEIKKELKRTNAVEVALNKTKDEGVKAKVKAVGKVMALGAATFAMPPVGIALSARTEYKKAQNAEHQRDRMNQLIGELKSHGISLSGAAEMAHLIVKGVPDKTKISNSDIRMWMVIVNFHHQELAQYTLKILERGEDYVQQW